MNALTRIRARFAILWRYRPRFLTLLVLAGVVATIVLSNLTFDLEYMGEFRRRSYGWPLVWYRCVLVEFGSWRTVGWYNSPPRLAGNIAMWLAMAAGSSAVCEWLLRRYRPRLRWNLRTMLAAVGLAAAFFAWFAAARNRAKVKDPIIVAMPRVSVGLVSVSPLKVERWGPKWLDLLGVDRFRRRIVSLSATLALPGSHKDDEELLQRVAQLPDLQELHIATDLLIPALPDALREAPRLRTLIVSRAYVSNDESVDARASHSCLATIGKMTQLEQLILDLRDMAVSPESLEYLSGLTNLRSIRLSSPSANRESLAAIGRLPRLECLDMTMELDSESVASLAGLTNLKSLYLEDIARSDGVVEEAPLFSRLPPLPRLESLGVHSPKFRDDDLRRLAALPRLKSLDIRNTAVTTTGLAALASLESLEELAVGGKAAIGAGHKSLLEVKHLKTLHIGHPRRVSAVKALQQARPDFVIDNGSIKALQPRPRIEWPLEWPIPYDAMPVRDFTWLPTSGAPWLTAAERAAFVERGGFAHFDAAEWRDEDGRKLEYTKGWGAGFY